MAKKISNENSLTVNPPPSQAQTLEPSGIQNSGPASLISNTTSNLSNKIVSTGAYDLSAGQDNPLDIAGVSTGMSPDQVKHTLTAKGYVLEETKKGPSFDELVKIKREHIQDSRLHSFNSAIKRFRFKKGVFETIQVNFLSMPGHPITNRVEYKNVDTSLTFAKIRHLLGDKYGDDRNAYDIKKATPHGLGTDAGLYEEIWRTTGTPKYDLRKAKLANLNRFEWFNRSEW